MNPDSRYSLVTWKLLYSCLFAAGVFLLPGPAAAEQIIRLETRDLAEASGLAVSHRNRDRLWTHNDGKDGALIYLLTLQGQQLGRFKLEGAANRDWEDIASYQEGDRAMLVLADIGDNTAIRPSLTLYFVEEPALPTDEDTGPPQTIRVSRSLSFRLPDGAADAEGLAVDVSRAEILLASKRDKPPRLYRLPLHPPEGSDDLVAEEVTAITGLPSPDLGDLMANLVMAAFSRYPTALDYDAASDSYLLTTYADTHIYRRKPGESLASLFQRKPLTVHLSVLPQMEGGAFCGDRQLCFISEKLPTQLMITDQPD